MGLEGREVNFGIRNTDEFGDRSYWGEKKKDQKR